MGDTFLRGPQLLSLNSLSGRGGILILRDNQREEKKYISISSQSCTNDDKNLSGDDPAAPYLIYSSSNYVSITVMSEK